MELFEYINIMNQPYDIFCSATADSPLHWHYYSEIIYVNSGSIRIVCNNQEVILGKGDLCYFYPLQLHSVTDISAEGDSVLHSVIKFNIQTLNIPKAYLQSIYDYFVNRTAEEDCCLVVHDDNTLGDIVGNIIDEYKKQQTLYMFAVQSGIQTLLINIARHLRTDKAPSAKHPDHSLSFYNILEYIDVHSAEPIEVSDLAERCNMSYSHFARKFREHYGRSCKEYIRYIRLNKAQDLLLHSDFDIDYIAQETGFYDSSHLIRQYKQWRGITPRKEREN